MEDAIHWGPNPMANSLMSLAEVLLDHLPLDLVRLVVPFMLDQQTCIRAVRRGLMDEVRFICTFKKGLTYSVGPMLPLAINMGHFDIFKFLCENKFKFDPMVLCHCLQLALKQKKLQFVRYILRRDGQYSSALGLILLFLNKYELSTLVRYAEFKETCNLLEMVPMITRKIFKAAVMSGICDLVAFIIQNPKFNSSLDKGDVCNAVTSASFRDHHELVHYLVGLGAMNINYTKHELLVRAATKNKPNDIRWLRSKGASITMEQILGHWRRRSPF